MRNIFATDIILLLNNGNHFEKKNNVKKLRPVVMLQIHDKKLKAYGMMNDVIGSQAQRNILSR